jgi:hypothetical protein
MATMTQPADKNRERKLRVGIEISLISSALFPGCPQEPMAAYQMQINNQEGRRLFIHLPGLPLPAIKKISFSFHCFPNSERPPRQLGKFLLESPDKF